MPTPFRQFSPANLFVAEVPFIWLPAFLVTSALFGHLLVFRKLHSETSRNSRLLSMRHAGKPIVFNAATSRERSDRVVDD